jgi:uncharacterized membrane protein
MLNETPGVPDVLPTKEPVSAAAGPYGHPIHPIMVTLPIGSWIGAVILDIGSHVVDNPAGLARGAFWLVAIGILGAVVAAAFGLMDMATIPRGTVAHRAALTHMSLNTVVLVLFVISYLARRGDDFAAPSNGKAMVLSIIGIALLAVSGWIGGMLSYRFGVRVARESTQVEGYRSTTATPAEGG